MVDWRAPVAEPFYRATGLDPQGLARRRHLAVRGRTVLGLEDEYFVDPDGRAGHRRPAGAGGRRRAGTAGERLLSDGMVLGGPGALLSALGQARTGHMGDIIGTIQREQDEIIRSPLAGVLVVQGGPGTGKTAVALHRAAYLLYTHRFPLERQGVLVVGPNPLFLRYIEQVLPSLGETGVSLSTVAGLVPEVRVRGVGRCRRRQAQGRRADGQGAGAGRAHPPATAPPRRRDPVRRGRAAPPCPRRPRTSSATARRRPGTHNARRRFVEAQVVRALAEEYRARLSRGGTDMVNDVPTQEEQADLAQRLRRVPEVAEALDRMWPRLSPHEFLHDLFGARPLLAAAGKGILERRGGAAAVPAAERLARRGALDGGRHRPDRRGPHPARPPARRAGPNRARAQRNEEASSQDVAFWPQGLATSPAPVTSPASGSDDEIRSFGHIVVDEVQDLSPMQLRMLARRSLSGSMTVVGDIAQATGPWAPQELGRRHAPPEPAAPASPGGADRELPHPVGGGGAGRAGAGRGGARPSRRRARSARRAPHRGSSRPRVRAWPPPWPTSHGRRRRRSPRAGWPCWGPPSCSPSWPAALADAGLDPVDPRDPAGDGLAAGLVVLPADETNGLEFDSVVVVEPSLVAAVGDEPAGEGPPVATTRGLRTLYVALTRPTKRLAVVHADPLPVELR